VTIKTQDDVFQPAVGRDNSDIDRQKVLDRDRNRCRNCGRGPEKDVELEIHHIVPLDAGGRDTLSNLVTVCTECHRAIHIEGATAPDVAENATFDQYPTGDGDDESTSPGDINAPTDLEDFSEDPDE
jgi:hypothetical protein